MDISEKLKQGKQAALAVGVWGFALSVVIAIAIGFFFAESEEPLLRRAHFIVAALGFLVTFTIVIHILTQDIAQHHYRENLKAEKDAERVNAEIAELEARRALYAAKERAVFTPLPGRTAPRLPERSEPAIYHNGKRVDDAEPAYTDEAPDDEEIIAPRPIAGAPVASQWRFIPREPEPMEHAEPDEAPARVARGQTVITESAAAYDLRISRLAREIYDLCRDVNPPTQAAIMERIPRTSGGLLRSNDDITAALDILAARGLIEASKGQGIVRYWLDERGEPLPKSARRVAISSNVPLSRA